MKSFVSTIITFTTAATALAAPTGLGTRQTGRLAQAFTPIGSSLQTLNTAVNSMTSDNTQTGFNVLSASNLVSNSMTAAANQISASGFARPAIADLSGLQSSADLFKQQVQVTMDSFTRQAPVFAQIGATQSAIQALEQQQSASGQLGQALVQQVPITAKAQASNSAQQINTLYSNGIAALQAGSTNAATTASSGTTGTQGAGTAGTQGSGTDSAQGSESGTNEPSAPGATGIPAFPGAAPAGVPAFPTAIQPFGRAVAAPVMARRG